MSGGVAAEKGRYGRIVQDGLKKTQHFDDVEVNVVTIRNSSTALGGLIQPPVDNDLELLPFRQNTGNARALFTVGIKNYRNGGEAQDFFEAALCYRRAAEQGHSRAQFNLGTMYAHGQGVKKDNIKAVFWYREAAHQGLSHAQCNLGNMYFMGIGVEKDWVTAMHWFQLSAAQGHKKAAAAIKHMNRTAEVQRSALKILGHLSH